jgi:hypothetical protein
MSITVVFPEFIFAKAVCELQMAVDDLHALSHEEEEFGWEVVCGRRLRLLYKLLHPWDFARKYLKVAILGRKPGAAAGSQSITTVTQPSPQARDSRWTHDLASGSWATSYNNKKRKWTLTHCYLANMGGLVFVPGEIFHHRDLPDPFLPMPLTAHQIMKCCLPDGHDPLGEDFDISEQEILDKSKAD